MSRPTVSKPSGKVLIGIATTLVLLALIFSLGAEGGISSQRESFAIASDSIKATDQSRCSASERESLEASFTAGSRWSLCWDLEPQVGLVISDAVYSTVTGASISILKSASLAQIFVPYDDGLHEQLDLPAFGSFTANIEKSDCPAGQIFPAQDPVLCTSIQSDGPRYEWYDYSFDTGNHTAEGVCFDLHTITPVDWYTYVNEWEFCDDGTIRGNVGAGGTLAPRYFGDDSNSSALGKDGSQLSLAHFHNVFWRVEFDLGGNDDSSLIEINDRSEGAKHWFEEEVFTVEAKRTTADGRSWRITSNSVLNSDNHAVSYDINAKNGDPYRDVEGHAYTDNDFYVTQYKECEILAAGNTISGCPSSVDLYQDGESLSRPVIWVQNGFHHLPRDEDEPIMNEHWQSFSMTPRDLTAKNELAPDHEPRH